MIFGIFAGITWALETVFLGIALGIMAPEGSREQIVFLAPFISTFLHDFCSAVWATIFNTARGNFKNVIHAFAKTKSGKFVSLAAIIGGPVGMTGYVLAINNLGSAVGAVASAVFPAIGSALAFFFLKEKMQWYRWIFLSFTMLGVYGLSGSEEIVVNNFALGIIGALMCAFGWGIEAVILAKCFKDPAVKNEYALQIRQFTSALIYGAILLPLLKGWGVTIELLTSGKSRLIPALAAAALFATVSYLCYYKAISKIGASKAMALDITYAAWAVFFTIIILKDYSLINARTILCTLVVIVCGILAATDFKELLAKKNK